MNLIHTLPYSFIIVFWFSAALVHTATSDETRYSKIMIWLAFVTVASLAIGNLI